jgi:hypothetical protein
MINDMPNQLIPSTINFNYPLKPIGHPRLSPEEIARRELQNNRDQKGKQGDQFASQDPDWVLNATRA